jgi:hypothetical protein
VKYILQGEGGDYECANGHEGSTPAARGIPYRCIHLGCDAPTHRTGDGSRATNKRLDAIRSNGAARIAHAKAARA